MTAACTVPATEILAHMYGMWLATGAVVLILAAAWLYARRRLARPEERAAVDTVFVAVAVPLVLLMLSLGPLCWRGSYGAVLNSTLLRVHYYEDKTVTVNICSADIELEPAEKALSLLGRRVNGLDDPAGGILAGNFTAKNNGVAMVLALRGAGKAIVAKKGRIIVILALPCTEKLYQEITAARHRLCTASR